MELGDRNVWKELARKEGINSAEFEQRDWPCTLSARYPSYVLMRQVSSPCPYTLFSNTKRGFVSLI